MISRYTGELFLCTVKTNLVGGKLMHIFFVNTSGKELENYSDIFEIQHVTRKLVSLECPLTEWSDNEKGYKACAQKMGEMIDSYKDMNNEFNLILYVDLLTLNEYTSIPKNRHRERYACLKVLHSIIKQYMKNTLINEMYESGRIPKEILLIFEENSAPRDRDETTESGKNLIRMYAQLMLGIPDVHEIDGVLFGNAKITEEIKISSKEFCERITERKKGILDKRIIYAYEDQVNTFISEMKGYETSETPLKRMLDRIIESSGEADNTVFSVSFETNRRTSESNKQENTRRNLRLCFYIMQCVEDGSVLNITKPYDGEVPNVKSFREIDWKKVAEQLILKEQVYQRKLSEVQRLSGSFSELNLAPVLYSLDNQRFAIDEYGDRRKVLDVVDENEILDKEQEKKDFDEGIVRLKDKKKVVVNKAGRSSLFSREEYPFFDYRWDDYDKGILEAKAKPDQYVMEAKKLRCHHLDYLQSLKMHVLDRMSNYAGRSAENTPALLRKRKVSVMEEGFEDEGRDYRYAKPGLPAETKRIKTVTSVSDAAYMSAVMEYMEFCAARSVAVTDIEEQCNWFVTRVHQIEASLRKIQLIVIGLIFVTLLLYLPFIILQWESIIKNTMTVLVALSSIAIPLILVYISFVAVTIVQRRKYRKVWKEFKVKSDQVLTKNALSAEKYDQLLTIYVPTLRWVYEYKLDVEFYEACCKNARAKINHHIQKMKERIGAIGIIIEDLEMDEEYLNTAEKEINSCDTIDYNTAFCSEKNKNFYSIIDLHVLTSVYK